MVYLVSTFTSSAVSMFMPHDLLARLLMAPATDTSWRESRMRRMADTAMTPSRGESATTSSIDGVEPSSFGRALQTLQRSNE